MLSGLEACEPRDLGDRLRAARSRAGLTQDEAARTLDVARTTVVAIEKGQRRVRPDEFRALADLYGLSVNALLRPDTVAVDLAPRFRALPGAPDGPAAEAARLLGDLVAAEVEIERLVGQPLRPNYPPERPIVPGDVREQAEDAAADLRQRLGLGLAPVADMVGLLEFELGVRVFVRPLPSGSLSGLFVYDEKVGACVLLNRNHPSERRGLTAAHELGHLVSARREPDVVDMEQGPKSREERYATAFALAFVMPAAFVRLRFRELRREAGRFSTRHLIVLAKFLNVSEEALCRRLEALDLLPGGTWDSIRDRGGLSSEVVRQAFGDARSEPQGTTVSPRLWLLAAEAHRRELLSEGQLARMLRMDRVEVRAMLDEVDAEGVNDLAVAAD